MMDPPDDDSTKSKLPPIAAARKTTTTKTTKITRSSFSSVETTPTQVTTEGLREKVARYEKVWSQGMQGEDNVIRVDVKDIEKRLQEERERRFAEGSSKVEFVKLRTTPQSTPGRESISPDSPFNVSLRHVERSSAEEDQRPDSPFNVTLKHVERVTSSEERYVTSSQEDYIYTRRTPPRSIDLTAGGSKISIKFDPNDEVDFSIEPTADIRVGSSGFRNLATESVITDGNRHQTPQTPQRISRTFIKSPVDGRSLTTISSPFVSQQTVKKVSSVYVKNLQKSYLEGTSGVGGGSVSVSASESSSRDDLSEEASEWYNDYRNQSFNSTMTARQFARTNSQYDNHIKEIRGRWFG